MTSKQRRDSGGQQRFVGNSAETREAPRHQPTARQTGLPTRLNISTSVSIVNFEIFWFTTSDTRSRDTIRICAASARRS